MTTTPAPAKKAAPAAPAPVASAPAVDPLVEEERAPRPFNLGDRVEFTDSVKFQFGRQKTFQQGEVIGVVEGEGMTIVAVGMEDSMAYDTPRIEFLYDGRGTTVMRKVEVSDGD